MRTKRAPEAAGCAGDWIIPADLDEFIQFPVPLPELIATMDAQSADHIMGAFRDRITEDGHFAETRMQPTLWEQYPLECDVSARLVQCLCKVALCRGSCVLSSGHHFVESPAREFSGEPAVLHHFKWRAGLVEALQRRLQVDRRESVPWTGEAVRVLDYVKCHGRIVPEHFAARRGWQP